MPERTTERTDDEINRSIAELMGAEQDGNKWVIPLPCGCPSYLNTLPDFTRDLNALRDGPEKVLREAGLRLVIESHRGGEKCASWATWARHGACYDDDDEARARALAVEAALTALRAVTT